MFRDREDAGRQLAEALRQRSWRDPVVLAIPRGGLVIGAAVARILPAELDVVLSRKLPAPGQPELAIGAVSEDGEVILNRGLVERLEIDPDYISRETARQLAEIRRRQSLYRQVRPAAKLTGRSVIVTDDGIATGSTMIAALHAARLQRPAQLVVAVPVGSPDRLQEVGRHCDEVICLLAPDDFWAVGQFYEYFPQLSDEEAMAILAEAWRQYCDRTQSPPISETGEQHEPGSS
ncbi:MAG: phosphoribosyltransferase [Gemmatales bacterium]|nr:phosphoribosyltransferase [Gemmatales bacterium]MDW8222876.1 phosphoribosyltransferase [Gemmatales bacterium]